jgi:DNA-binding CsgD family transcriptional regulator
MSNRTAYSRAVGLTGVPTLPALIGRDAECALVDGIISRLPEAGGALLVRGEAGIGKSALLERGRVTAVAAGAQALITVGVESETELTFAGLHQLLLPIFGLNSRLPVPLGRAVDAVFGVTDEAAPDLYRVAMAALYLLTVAAESAPLVLVIDDAQWIDRASARVIAFIARRLENEPIALLGAVRTGYATPLDEAGLAVLDLERLSPIAAGQLVDLRSPGLHPIVRARVLAEAAGNPLAIVELARSIPTERAASGIPLQPTSLTARLERAFAARLDELPGATRDVLLAAALDSRASFEEVRASAALIRSAAVPTGSLDAATSAGLVAVVNGELQFRHPLIRSAVRQGATSDEVVEMYRALSQVVDDPERRLWHRAMSATVSDEGLAADLETYANASARRGAVTVAAAALERAAALSGSTQLKARRLVSAAEFAYELGLGDVVGRLVEQTKDLDLAAADHARLTWLGEITTGNVWSEPGAAKTFVNLARRIAAGGDRSAALRSLVPIAHRSWWTRPRATTRHFIVEAAQSLGTADDDPSVLAVIALADPEVTGPAVLRMVSRLRLHDVADPVNAMYVGIAAEKAGDFALGARFLASAVNGLREQVRLGLLAQALVHQAWAATYAGEWTAAAGAAAEGAVLARDTNQPQHAVTGELIAALVAAMRGAETDIEGMLAGPERTILVTRGGPLRASAHLARGAAALGDGRYEDAMRALWPVFDDKDEAFHRFMRWPAVLDLVEAAAGSGQLERIRDVVAELEAIAAKTNPPILSAGLACARPLLAPNGEGDALFEAALAKDLGSHRFLRARTLFAFGRRLRRQRRSADAREPLRKSIELFDALGATRWSGRARDELRAAGETVGKRTPDARDRLTAQELQIAQLAAQGLSNREIGERLFVSHRTIGSHLYHIYPKLGITARTQLRDALRTSESD